jgi:vomeronasal 2 receptor
MFILLVVFFLLNIPILVAVIDPRCFWRINMNEVKDKDLGTLYSFIIGAVQLLIKKDYFNQTLPYKCICIFHVSVIVNIHEWSEDED